MTIFPNLQYSVCVASNDAVSAILFDGDPPPQKKK
jgi:hypothetical protein